MFGTFLGRDIAIDLGTANTLVYVRGEGIVLREPSVIAIDNTRGKVLAVGAEAKQMLGRTPGTINAHRPMKDGVIRDADYATEMIRHFIRSVHKNRYLNKPRVVICVPIGATQVEKKTIKEAARGAGAREVFLIPEPMAAAIGAGLPVGEARGNMVCDIGGGTSEIAVISLGGIVCAKPITVGGDAIDDAIINWIRREYSLHIGYQTAEKIKIEAASAYPTPGLSHAEIRGRDVVNGLPRTVTVTPEEIRKAIEEPVLQIIDAIKGALDQTPPELSSDIIDRGIILTGGGALLTGLVQRVESETGIVTHVAESSEDCVVLGSGKCLENFESLKRVFIDA
ncbi:MAG: rod shape-determining protein [Candidatus Nanopelagicales bacterium]